MMIFNSWPGLNPVIKYQWIIVINQMQCKTYTLCFPKYCLPVKPFAFSLSTAGIENVAWCPGAQFSVVVFTVCRAYNLMLRQMTPFKQ